MRQLKETGWMHNRLRMITAMFLVKDLGIDWRMAQRFDPDGHFIRRHVRELAGVADPKAVHDPHGVLGAAAIRRLGYPAPIVDHRTASRAIVGLFKAAADAAKQAK
ncbi:hypothetical protein HK405_002204, partial [Cladochytrium tenue]